MSAKSYPFIDIAVHARVREHFARGDAAVLFSADMTQVLWSNGEGASLFGIPSIYDFIDSGAEPGEVAFRQMEATARQLSGVGDSRSFLMRVGSGFRRVPVSAKVEMISVHPNETAVLFTAPATARSTALADIAARMISGFDDPDTHMAVLDGDGAVLAASPGFEGLAMTQQTCRSLVSAVARDSDWLVKRPIPTGKGHLPAAIGKLSDAPALHLLFAVETILGNLDAGTDFDEPAHDAETPAVEERAAKMAAHDDAETDAHFLRDGDETAGDLTAGDAEKHAFETATDGSGAEAYADMVPDAEPRRTLEIAQADDTAATPMTERSEAPVAEAKTADAETGVAEPGAAADGSATPDDVPMEQIGTQENEPEDEDEVPLSAEVPQAGDAAALYPAENSDAPEEEALTLYEATDTAEPGLDLDGLQPEPDHGYPETSSAQDHEQESDDEAPRAAGPLQADDAVAAPATETSDAPAEDAVTADETAPEVGADETHEVRDDIVVETTGALDKAPAHDETDASIEEPVTTGTQDFAGETGGETAGIPEDEAQHETTAVVAGEPETPTSVETSEQDSGARAAAATDEEAIAQRHRAEAGSDDAGAAAIPATPEDGAQDADETTASGFVFSRSGRAVRFVWKIDSQGRFREISDEFAMAVGPASADISGVSFTDVAHRYNLDPDGKIGDLLKKRDTWSGKTILWPVEGTSLQVPVDLAALPTYSRNREFDGFRGFGIVRVSDAIEDERATGLTLGRGDTPQSEASAPEASALERLDETGSTQDVDIIAETEAQPDAGTALTAGADVNETDDGTDPEPETEGHSDAPETSASEDLFSDLDAGLASDAKDARGDETDDPFEDPFRGERPALQLVESGGIRTSDKVIRLDNHRPGSESLTRGEQAAFREIARQLGETFGKRSEGPPTDEPKATEETFETPIFTDLPSDEVALPAEDETVPTEPAEEAPPEVVGASVPATPVEAIPEDVPVADALNTPEAGPSGDEEAKNSETTHDIEAETESSTDADVAAPLPIRASMLGSLNPELLDTLPVALLVHAGDELYHANPEFLELTGYPSLEALRDEGGIDALFVAEDDDLFDMPDGTMMMISNDGRLVRVKARLQSIRWEEKGALMMALSAAPAETRPAPAELPATQPETAAAASAEDQDDLQTLRMEAEELRSILETATDGVAIVGADGEIRSLNRSASALFNYDDTEIRGKPFAMLFAHESQKAVLDYLSGLSGHGVASVLNDGREVIGREASGGFIPLFMTMGRLASSNGYCAVIRDITQWKRTEEELRNAKRAAETANAHKTDFLARVSHEIRTPLNAIIGFSDMMASEHFGAIGNPRYVEYANDIGRSGRHVLDIVNDLLDISKIEAGEMDLEFTAVEINDAVSEAVSLVQPQANSQRVIIRTSLSGSVPNIVADSRSIKQIALNILSNAIRFTPSGGQIVVSTAYEANGSVILRIRDTGIGMTRSELEQAMKPFRQVTTGARKRGDGTGLGLPLTKAMAEANRAQFSINSAPNEGTLVEISFPSQRVLAD